MAPCGAGGGVEAVLGHSAFEDKKAGLFQEEESDLGSPVSREGLDWGAPGRAMRARAGTRKLLS